MRRRIVAAKPVMAAPDFMEDLKDVEDLSESIDNAADAVEDIQDVVDDIDDAPEDTLLDIDNNIENHYIAECTRCHEVFISAVVESESSVDSIEGECPCCHEQTKQELKWIVRSPDFGK
mgnify:CR=1 FL=1